MPDSETRKKVISNCIYCSNPPDGEEHWLNRSFGKFAGNTLLTDRICTPCNVKFGGSIDLELARTSHTGVTRQLLGIAGRAGHERKNVFEYKAAQAEPPVQVFRVDRGNLTPVFEQVVGHNPDGTLIATLGRVLVIETKDGQQQLRLPKGWNEQQLRSAAEARGLLDGRPISAHVAPPETVDEFLASAMPLIRAVFGRHEMAIYHSRLDGVMGEVKPTLLRFNLSPDYYRGVAKVAFHYFLWACPGIGGDEPAFSGIRSYIHDGIGEPASYIQMTESLVDRIPAESGPGDDAHVFASAVENAELIVRVHFFSRPVGPAFPSFLVKLGPCPDALRTSWRSVHVAAYKTGVPGHDGVLRELRTT